LYSSHSVNWIKNLIISKIDAQIALLLAFQPGSDENLKLHNTFKFSINSLEDYKNKASVTEGEFVSDIAASLRGWESKMGMRTINPNAKKNYIQPEELEIVILKMIEFLKEIEAEILKMTAIDYGRQIRIGNTKIWCEINIFYGKKGVRVVGTTKSGSNKELCDNMVKYLQSNFETF